MSFTNNYLHVMHQTQLQGVKNVEGLEKKREIKQAQFESSKCELNKYGSR